MIFDNDFNMKDTGEHHVFREVGVYFIEDEKIVREEFFYSENELAEAKRLNEAGAAAEG